MIGLVTNVDLDQDVLDSRWVSVSARQHAILTTGDHVPVIDHRGWCHSGPPTWTDTCTQDIIDTAREVVGPLLPGDGHPHPDLRATHWAGLAATLGRHGIHIDAQDLPGLPHHVTLSPQLQQHLGHEVPRSRSHLKHHGEVQPGPLVVIA